MRLCNVIVVETLTISMGPLLLSFYLKQVMMCILVNRLSPTQQPNDPTMIRQPNHGRRLKSSGVTILWIICWWSYDFHCLTTPARLAIIPTIWRREILLTSLYFLTQPETTYICSLCATLLNVLAAVWSDLCCMPVILSLNKLAITEGTFQICKVQVYVLPESIHVVPKFWEGNYLFTN